MFLNVLRNTHLYLFYANFNSQTDTEEFGDAGGHCVPPEECLAEIKVTKPSNL